MSSSPLVAGSRTLSRSYAIADSWALRYYMEALALHDAGCALSPEQMYTLLENAASVYDRLDEPGKSLWLLKRSAKKWPDSPWTRFKLAALFCRNGDLKQCYDQLKATLELAAAKQSPPFHKTAVSGNLSVAWYVRHAPDHLGSAPFPADPQFAELIATYESFDD